MADAKSSVVSGTIDRQTLVHRHNVVLTQIDSNSPLSVGNGEFAFTADVTGLQSFLEPYAKSIPLCTMSHWGWHSDPKPEGLDLNLKMAEYDSHGRTVRYHTSHKGQDAAFNYLRENPHRMHLGRVGFAIHTKDGRLAGPGDLKDIRQELDLWTGTLVSRFSVNGDACEVRTCCHPARDAIAVQASGPLVEKGWVSVIVKFPYPSPNVNAADWSHPDRHQTTEQRREATSLVLARVIDAERYFTRLAWSDGDAKRVGDHDWELTPKRGADRFWFTGEFTQTDPKGEPLAFAAASDESARYWPAFWQSGGAVDFDGSTDPRAKELERRVVLSQYLTAIQCSGTLPPAETGLTCNSWYGKFHLEMHWWHAAHFALWGRLPLLERSLGYYSRIIDGARARAKENGWTGARWPKMTDPAGVDSPSPIGPLLIWEQPHPIYYAELCYRADPKGDALKKYAEIVEESARFMGSFAYFEQDKNRYVLGPPVIPAQENHPPRETWNPTYELSYWVWGLKVAQQWRQRRGQPREPHWDDVIAKISKLPVKDGVYLAHENCPQTFTERNKDHPSMLMALGFCPGDGVDRDTMLRTLQKVIDVWDWPDTWGWDYGMCAMTAARLSRPDLAVDLLLKDAPKNHYFANGHNYQRPGLSLYLPGNGATLAAVAMMAGGWHGGPQHEIVGFPKDNWTVRAEGLLPIM